MSLRRYHAILRTPQVRRLLSASVLGRLPLGMVGMIAAERLFASLR